MFSGLSRLKLCFKTVLCLFCRHATRTKVYSVEVDAATGEERDVLTSVIPVKMVDAGDEKVNPFRQIDHLLRNVLCQTR